MKEPIATSSSRRHVPRLVATVMAWTVTAKASTAAEPLKAGIDEPYFAADGVSTFESVWLTVRDRFYDPRCAARAKKAMAIAVQGAHAAPGASAGAGVLRKAGAHDHPFPT